jgi:hypothetical protein
MFNRILPFFCFCFIQFVSIAATPDCILKMRELGKIDKSDFQILFLKGGDCINCYKAGQLALQSKDINPVAIFIKDVSKREIDDFLEQNMAISHSQYPVVRNDSLWDCLNRYGTSAIGYFSGDKMTKIIQTKYLYANPESIIKPQLNLSVLKPIDSIDITHYYGGFQSTVTPIDSDYLIYNNTKRKITQYSIKNHNNLHVFDLGNIPYLKLDSMYRFFPSNKAIALSNTIKMSSPTSLFLNGKFQMNSPYVSANRVYVPLSVMIVDTVKMNGVREEVAMSYSILGVYSHKRDLQKLIVLPYFTLEGNDNICNSLSNSTLVGDCRLNMMMGVAGRRDSVFSSFDFCSTDKLHPTHFLNVRYPDSFPILNKQGINRSYMTKFVTIENQDYYYFCLDNHLRSLKNDSKIKLSHIESNNFTDDIQLSFINDMQVDRDTLYVLYSANKYNTLRLNKYSVKDMAYISTTTVSSYKTASSFIQKDMIVTIYADDERVTMYRYKYR